MKNRGQGLLATLSPAVWYFIASYVGCTISCTSMLQKWTTCGPNIIDHARPGYELVEVDFEKEPCFGTVLHDSLLRFASHHV